MRWALQERSTNPAETRNREPAKPHELTTASQHLAQALKLQSAAIASEYKCNESHAMDGQRGAPKMSEHGI